MLQAKQPSGRLWIVGGGSDPPIRTQMVSKRFHGADFQRQKLPNLVGGGAGMYFASRLLQPARLSSPDVHLRPDQLGELPADLLELPGWSLGTVDLNVKELKGVTRAKGGQSYRGRDCLGSDIVR